MTADASERAGERRGPSPPGGATGARRALLLAVVLALGAGSWLVEHRVLPWGPWAGDALEYSVIARRIAGGEGFTTPVIFPIELGWGAGEDHPSLMRAPLWPLVLSAFLAVSGGADAAVHAAALACFLGLLSAAFFLATALAGATVGALAATVVAFTPQVTLYAIDGMSEPLFAALVTAALALWARGARPFAIGVACGLAYLARYNGAVVGAALGLAVLLRPPDDRGRVRAMAELAAGALVVAAPWWIRNVWVTGNPVYSIYHLMLYAAPFEQRQNAHLHFMLEPDLGAASAVDPAAKFAELLPYLLAHWPFAGANLAAFAGLVLACARRDAPSLALAGIAVATTVVVALTYPSGRYFVPFLPAAVALGAAGWARFGGRWKVPALALLAAAPWLPNWPPDLPDVARMREFSDAVRAGAGYRPGSEAAREEAQRALARCLAGRPVVLAENAARLAWRTDAIAIHLPATRRDFWRIVDAHPVRFVELRRYRRVPLDELRAHFSPRPDCGPGLYERVRGSGPLPFSGPPSRPGRAP